MPHLHATIPHHLSRREVRRRISSRLPELRRQLAATLGKVEAQWDGDTLKFSVAGPRGAVTGHLTVENRAIRLNASLPWYLGLLAKNANRELISAASRLVQDA